MIPTLDRDGDVFVLRLGDDENRFTHDFLEAVNTALDEVQATPGTALVTTGVGKQFSSGLALEWMIDPANADVQEDYLRGVDALLARVLTFPAYTVAAVNGHAFGGGAMLAVAHDLRLMRADRGFWCLPEVDLGLPFRPVMQAVLQARVPTPALQHAMVTSARVGGEQAARSGIVDGTASEERLLAVAVEAAAPHAAKSRDVLATVKGDLHAAAVALLPVG